MQDFLLEFSSRTNQQLESFRAEQRLNNEQTKKDINSLQKQIDNSINDCTKSTSNELTYTNKIFNTQIAESESKLLNQNNQLLKMLIDLSNKSNFQFESVKECCIVQSNNMKSIIGALQNIINSSFYDLENSNRQSLDVIGNSLTLLNQKLDVERSRFTKDDTPPTTSKTTEKSFKIIKNYFDQQKAQTTEEKIQKIDNKLNSLISKFNKLDSKTEKTEKAESESEADAKKSEPTKSTLTEESSPTTENDKIIKKYFEKK